ncbi:hypothetical protein GJ496_002490 [Pomphorhynchus laevis]|nr:hypothetical protein GJ496_002490 [Pomphorhynchus laevis]
MRHFLNFQTWCAIIYIIYLYEKASSVTDSDALQKDALQSTNVIDDDYSLDNDSSNTSTDNPLAVDKIIKSQNDNELKSTSELMPFVTTVQTSSDCNNCSTNIPKCRLKQDGTPTTDCITEIFTDERCWKCNGFNEICPDDSLLVKLEYPLCCNSTAIKCQCKKCQPIKCGSNQSLMFLSVGSNKPGSCCDTYKCIEGPDMCSYDKVIYKDGDVCRKTCQPQMGCGYMYTPANECCSICGGCMSDSRLFMLNQSWFEADGCFKCNCYQGRAKCTAEYCLSPPCKNPKKIENVCCPVCEDGNL